jgi:hypothetical protein
MPIHHVTYAMPNARNAQRKAIHMLPPLLEGRQNGLDTTGKRELPHTQLKKSNTHQVPPANE